MIYHSKDEAAGGSCGGLADLDAEARAACDDLRNHLSEFDLIAATGLSGILPAVAVSLKLKVPLAILRKPGDNTHQCGGRRFHQDGSRWVNGEAIQSRRVLWLDDFVSSGNTRVRIKHAVAELGGEVTCEYLTRDREFAPYRDGKPDRSIRQ